jgi:hypothetical protein
MRFAIDVVFLDRHLREISTRTALAPGRFACDRRAWATLERPSEAPA